MSTAALGLGSNLGNRLLNLQTAVESLKRSGLGIVKSSDVFESEPWGVTDQPCFLNSCLLVETSLAPEQILELLKNTESEMGRKPSRRWGERLIDIDILLMDSETFDSPNLTIPHPEMHRRDFVLIPLAQIVPNWFHPLLKKTVGEMASGFHESLTRIGSLVSS